MKKTLIAMAIMLLSYTAITAETKFQFGIKSGFGNLNSAYFGADLGKLSAIGGVQVGMVNMTNTRTTSTKYIDGFNDDEKTTREETVSLTLYNVFVGTNIDLFRVNDVQTYISAIISKPIVSVTDEIKYSDSEDYSSDDELGDFSIWGGQLGFGSEYYFSENFSVGGEFGLQYYIFSSDDTSETEDSYETQKIVNELSMGAGLTYSTIVLNFYF